MALLDMIVPGRAKANLRRDIEELNEAALRETQRQGLSPKRAALWEAFCNGAYELVTELFVENSNKQLNWGMRRHRRKLNQPRLVAVYWWMLLYHLVLLRNRGLDGYAKNEEFAELSRTADDFIEHVVSSLDFNAVHPGPWEERWEAQVCLEASLGMYNRVSDMLGVHVDPDARILRVSLFTSATERAYDANIKKAIAERNRVG